MGPWESVPAPAVAEGGRAGTGAGPRETGGASGGTDPCRGPGVLKVLSAVSDING